MRLGWMDSACEGRTGYGNTSEGTVVLDDLKVQKAAAFGLETILEIASWAVEHLTCEGICTLVFP